MSQGLLAGRQGESGVRGMAAVRGRGGGRGRKGEVYIQYMWEAEGYGRLKASMLKAVSAPQPVVTS